MLGCAEGMAIIASPSGVRVREGTELMPVTVDTPANGMSGASQNDDAEDFACKTPFQ
jgi:hypothetical protein